MEVTGTITSVRRMRTDYGSTFIRVTISREGHSAQRAVRAGHRHRAAIARPGTHDIPLTWLHGFETVPARGQRVTITGIPMMTSPRKGSYRTNISVTALTIHDQED